MSIGDEVGTGLRSEIERLADGEAGGYEETCTRLLHLLRRHVHMQVAWISEFVGAEQVLRMVDGEPGLAAPAVGTTTSLHDAYCSRVLAGTMPALIPDVRDEPTAVWLDVTFSLQIGSYLGVPLHGADGTPQGMLCAISSGPTPGLDEHALTTARLVAQVIDELHRRALGEGAARRARAELERSVGEVCAGTGRWTVLQPFVDLATGDAVAAEALTRFADGGRTPSAWFAAAHSVGLGRRLEVAAARGALALLERDDAPAALAVNVSPDVALGELDEVLAGVADCSRVILEVTEYAPVEDYAALETVLAPYRRRGLRVAVDDAGAGYSSMSHVLKLRPDLLKVDMSLVRDVDQDPIRQALVGALVRFAAVAGATVVAEGVETEAELEALAALGVPLAQGYLFGMPCDHPRWHGHPHHRPDGDPHDGDPRPDGDRRPGVAADATPGGADLSATG